jgi:hypothetical protein
LPRGRQSVISEADAQLDDINPAPAIRAFPTGRRRLLLDAGLAK